MNDYDNPLQRYRSPWYRFYRTVRAAKIKGVRRNIDGTAMLSFGDERKQLMCEMYHVVVSSKYFKQYSPRTGGYYVAHNNGHESYSPAEEFEEIFTLVQD